MIGIDTGIPRLPLVPANEKEKEQIKKVLQELGLIK